MRLFCTCSSCWNPSFTTCACSCLPCCKAASCAHALRTKGNV
uniref:Uncharacterized protein n=1 Tax=Arundo donax TaxID=35708 RepID=A0A0A9EQL0_ARUDO